MGELFSIFNRDLVKNKPGSRNQENKRLYESGKEAFGKLGDILFSGHAKEAVPCLQQRAHSRVLSKLLPWLLLWKRTEELG